MNLEIKVKGLEIKIEQAGKKEIDRIIASVMYYEQGGNFNEVFDVAQQYVKWKKEGPKNFIAADKGIKDYGDGKFGYKCSYMCVCGHKGVRYPKEDEDFVHCHSCNEKLNIVPATENEAHDQDYNYFLAY